MDGVVLTILFEEVAQLGDDSVHLFKRVVLSLSIIEEVVSDHEVLQAMG